MDRSIIHPMAVAYGTAVGILPIAINWVALGAVEAAMVINIGEQFGVDVPNDAVRSILIAAGCTDAGNGVFAPSIICPPFLKVYRITAAITLLEEVGNRVYDYFASGQAPMLMIMEAETNPNEANILM